MSDVQVKRFEDLPSYADQGQFVFAGKGLGVSSFGINVLKLPPNWADYPEHDETKTGQEEVYVVMAGTATLTAAGFSVGGYVGYKVQTNIGFAFIAQGGIQYLAVAAESSTAMASDSKIAPLLNLNVGWSF